MKIFLRIVLVMFLLGAVALGYGAWILLGSKTSNPRNYRTIGDIPTPWGYELSLDTHQQRAEAPAALVLYQRPTIDT